MTAMFTKQQNLVAHGKKCMTTALPIAGMVQYTFHPQSANNGTVDIFTSDWAAGDTTVYRIYTVTDAGHLQISHKPDDTSVALTVDCDIHRLTSTQMIWNKPGTSEEIARFTKEK